MLRRIIPHLCVVISIMVLVLLGLDQVNKAMNFIGNDVFKILLLCYCLTAIPTSILLVRYQRRRR